jgi:hypothetical protein
MEVVGDGAVVRRKTYAVGRGVDRADFVRGGEQTGAMRHAQYRMRVRTLIGSWAIRALTSSDSSRFTSITR